jgi:hypothetical protein
MRGAEKAKIFLVTTPEGFKATYNIFVQNKKPSMQVIHAKTTDNPHLPKSYTKRLFQMYDERLVKAYINGQFINLQSGTVYYAFDRYKNIKAVTYHKGLDVIVCFDFNVNPMCMLICQVMGDIVVVLAEWTSKTHSNTAEAASMALHILRQWDDLRSISVRVYGDASGRFGSASSNLTSYDIIETVFFDKFKQVSYYVPASNPAVKDRINCMNVKLSKQELVINTSCSYLLQDFEQVVWDAKGGLDKTNPALTHVSDALGYFIAFEYPVLERFSFMEMKNIY